MKSTISLTEAEVVAIIKEHFESLGYTGVKNVNMRLGVETSGYGPYESDNHVFKGAEVDVDVAPVVKKKHKVCIDDNPEEELNR